MAEPLSATIGALYDKAVSSSAPSPAPSEPAPAQESPAPTQSSPKSSDTGPTSSPSHQGEATTPTDTPPPGQRTRDPSGRFAKADGASPPATPEGTEKPPTEATPAQPAQALKPPGRFKPEAREMWSQVPPLLQAEVKRMEVEHRKEIETSAQARRLAEEFQSVVQPYTPLFTRAPLEEVKGLLETARVLRSAPPAQKAAMAAQILQTFAIDPGLVADAMEGKQPASQPHQQEFRDPRLDQLLSERQQLVARRQQEVRAKAQEELAEFQASEPEFFDDVRHTMGVLMSAAHEEGRKMTLQEAYESACLANATVRPLYQKRQSAIAAATAPQALSQGKAATLRHEPSIPASGKPRSLADDIAANYEALTRGR